MCITVCRCFVVKAGDTGYSKYTDLFSWTKMFTIHFKYLRACDIST